VLLWLCIVNQKVSSVCFSVVVFLKWINFFLVNELIFFVLLCRCTRMSMLTTGLKVQNQVKVAHGFVQEHLYIAQGIMIASNSVSFFHTRSMSMDLHCFVQQHFFTC
jgi:hypothetical protein